jgi:hypothetical protein
VNHIANRSYTLTVFYYEPTQICWFLLFYYSFFANPIDKTYPKAKSKETQISILEPSYFNDRETMTSLILDSIRVDNRKQHIHGTSPTNAQRFLSTPEVTVQTNFARNEGSSKSNPPRTQAR